MFITKQEKDFTRQQISVSTAQNRKNGQGDAEVTETRVDYAESDARHSWSLVGWWARIEESTRKLPSIHAVDQRENNGYLQARLFGLFKWPSYPKKR